VDWGGLSKVVDRGQGRVREGGVSEDLLGGRCDAFCSKATMAKERESENENSTLRGEGGETGRSVAAENKRIRKRECGNDIKIASSKKQQGRQKAKRSRGLVVGCPGGQGRIQPVTRTDKGNEGEKSGAEAEAKAEFPAKLPLKRRVDITAGHWVGVGGRKKRPAAEGQWGQKKRGRDIPT